MTGRAIALLPGEVVDAGCAVVTLATTGVTHRAAPMVAPVFRKLRRLEGLV
jgi:hypothetical protein